LKACLKVEVKPQTLPHLAILQPIKAFFPLAQLRYDILYVIILCIVKYFLTIKLML
jgi:hypothetical protein